MAQVTGIVRIYLNGALQRSKDGATLDMGGKQRSAVTGHSVYGPTEKIVESTVKFTLAHTADTDLLEINNLTDASVRFETDVGITYLVTGAWASTPCSLGAGGDVTVELKGQPAIEE